MKHSIGFHLFSRRSAAAALALTLLCGVFFGATGRRVSEAVDNRLRRLPIYCVETLEQKIAVTFDAAWSAADTDLLISILKKHNAKATFFAVGTWVRDNPEAVKKLFDAGHEIANHSDTHAAFSKCDRAAVTKEITDCNERIKALTGKVPALVRAPSGDYDNKSIECAEALGMKMVQWSVDSLDWKGLSAEEMTARIVTRTEPGAILLFHNGVENTPDALDASLTKLSKKGYCFVTASELLLPEPYRLDHTGKQIPLKDTLSEAA